MKTSSVTIQLPSRFEDAIHTTAEEVEQQIRVMAALKLFELGKLSSGKAAELAGQSRVEFFETCARYKVSAFNYPAGEIDDEIREDFKTASEIDTQ